MAPSDHPPQNAAGPAERPSNADRLVGGLFAVEPSRPMLGGGGGLPAFVAERRGVGPRGMAVQAMPDAPPRMEAITALSGASIPGVLAPLAVGPARGSDGRDAVFVICTEPPGPPLSAEKLRVWDEQELLHTLLRPVSLALAALQGASVAHRAVRLDNLFRGGKGEPVVLGCGWASPPAMLQPAIYEPPYIAMCLPAARGEGSIADDVYALGVVMLALALGHVPLAGLDGAEVQRRKLEQGSFKALIGQERVSPIIADLVSGMLAEDPEHRPPPKLLSDPIAARARRVAARPPRRGQRALEVGGREVWNARSLAHALASEIDGGARLLRSGAVDGWLRRGLGEAALAARIEEAVRLRISESVGEDSRADAMLAMRAVVSLDPLAPLAWEGIALWPDGIGPLLASLPVDPVPQTGDTGHGDRAIKGNGDKGRGDRGGADKGDDVAAKVARLILSEAAILWAAQRAQRCDIVTLRLDMRQHRAKLRLAGWGGGLPRLRFALNPLLPCRSRLLGEALVLRLTDLLPALEAAARPEIHTMLPVDREIAAFIAARDDQRSEAALGALGQAGGGQGGDDAAIPPLRLLATLQQRLGGRALPRLGAWFAHHLAPMAASWRNRARRERCAEALAEAAAGGQLAAILATVQDTAARAEDAAGARRAEAAVRHIDDQLAALAAGGLARAEAARRIGGELATGIGIAALAVTAVAIMAG
jgi:hypothetical protein